jgi:hypothetical protein
MQTPQPFATLTALDLHRAVLRVQGVVVQVHHARQSGGEPHPIRDSSIPIQSNQFVPLGDVVQETDKTLKPSTPPTYLFLSLAKKVSGTQIFSAKSPESVNISSSLLKANLSSFQY